MKRLVRFYVNGYLFRSSIEYIPIAYFKAWMWKFRDHPYVKRSYEIKKL